MNCYKHNDDYGSEHTPTDDQKEDCKETEDVCVKISIEKPKTHPNYDGTIEMKRDCDKQERIKEYGWNGSECTKHTTEYNYTYTYCGCTTDYCNTSTFAEPFHFLPMITLSVIKVFFVL